MPDVTITIPDALHARLLDRHGSVASVRQWTRDTWRADIRNWRVQQAQIQAQAIIEAAERAADAEAQP